MLLFGHGQCCEGKTFALLTLCVLTPKKDSEKLPEVELLRFLLILPHFAVQISHPFWGQRWGRVYLRKCPSSPPPPSKMICDKIST